MTNNTESAPLSDSPLKEVKRSRGHAFVDYIISRCKSDNGVQAALKRADNPATEYQSWDVLATFGVNLEHENQRIPHATIAAAIARAKLDKNGATGIGWAIAKCYEDGNTSEQAKAKLRRLLACDNATEVCRILRPLFSLVESKSTIGLNYAMLLDDLLWFGYEDSQVRIKARWAMDFYRKSVTGEHHE